MKIAGDFNAKAIVCRGGGEYKTDRRGTSLVDMLTKKGIVPVSIKGGHTFCRNGRRSFINVISTDKGLASKYVAGRIPEVWTASEHSHVLHDFRTKKEKRDIHNFRYLTKEADMEKFILTFDSDYDNLFMTNSDLDEEVHGQRLQAAVETSCDSEPRKVHPPTGKRTKNYWWSEELAALRRVVM